MRLTDVLRNQQRTVAIGKETEIMGESIIVNHTPIIANKCRDKEQQSTLRLVKISDDHLHYLVIIACRGYDNLR